MSRDTVCSYASREELTRTVYSTYVGCFSHDCAKMSDRSHIRDEGFCGVEAHGFRRFQSAMVGKVR